MSEDTAFEQAMMQGVAAQLRAAETILNHLQPRADGRALAEIENVLPHVRAALLAAGLAPAERE